MSLKISIKREGFLKNIERLKDVPPEVLQKSKNIIINEIYFKSQRYVPVESGDLKASGITTPDGVYYSAPYSVYVEYGVGPHIITPRWKKVLHFITGQGEEVFTKLVHHPGFVGRFFLKKAYLETMQNAPKILERYFVEAISHLR